MPDFLDADRLAQISIVVLLALVVVAVVVAKVVKTIVTKAIFLSVIAIAAFAVYSQRDEFKECQATCSCTLFGQDVEVPDNPACGEDAIDISELLNLELLQELIADK